MTLTIQQKQLSHLSQVLGVGYMNQKRIMTDQTHGSAFSSHSYRAIWMTLTIAIIIFFLRKRIHSQPRAEYFFFLVWEREKELLGAWLLVKPNDLSFKSVFVQLFKWVLKYFKLDLLKWARASSQWVWTKSRVFWVYLLI